MPGEIELKGCPFCSYPPRTPYRGTLSCESKNCPIYDYPISVEDWKIRATPPVCAENAPTHEMLDHLGEIVHDFDMGDGDTLGHLIYMSDYVCCEGATKNLQERWRKKTREICGKIAAAVIDGHAARKKPDRGAENGTVAQDVQKALSRLIQSLCLYLAECSPRCERQDGAIGPTRDEINRAIDTIRTALEAAARVGKNVG